MRPVHEILPKFLVDELLRLARLDRNWVRWRWEPNGSYSCRDAVPTPLRAAWRNGSDAFGMWALSHWLVDGPKTFEPTAQQCEDMEQIEVRLHLTDYEQPYPALMVELPPGRYAPFERVLCHRTEELATFQLLSGDHLDDIVTTIAVDGRPMEESIQRYDADCASLGVIGGKVLRVAVNSCLCLLNFGHRRAPLRPAEVAADRRLAREDTERGRRARERLRTAAQVVSFDREVVLRDTGDGVGGTGGRVHRVGGEKSPHWRRGHWAMQPHGPGNSLRKRVLRRPKLVRANLLLGDESATTTNYTSR